MRALVVLCSESGTHEITDNTGGREQGVEGIRLIEAMSDIRYEGEYRTCSDVEPQKEEGYLVMIRLV